MYNKTMHRKLETALGRIKRCGGECGHCEKCHIYTAETPHALFMAVGCDLLPQELFDSIADVPSQLHAAALETLEFELS